MQYRIMNVEFRIEILRFAQNDLYDLLFFIVREV